MRLNWTDDEDFPGQFALWQGNCRRSLRSKAGQAALRRLEAALLAMPEKALIRGKLVNSRADVCALGALARAEGKLPTPEPPSDDEWDDDDEDDTAEWATDHLDVPKLVAWSIVAENDITNDEYETVTAEGPGRYRYGYQNQGVPLRIQLTADRRYANVLAWVRSQLSSEADRP